MLAADVGMGALGVFFFAFLIFCDDFHSCDNWRKINSMERKTKKTLKPMAGIPSCGKEDTEKEPLVKNPGEGRSLGPPLEPCSVCGSPGPLQGLQ